MGEVNISINDRAFKLGCDDGEEPHLLVLAEHLGKHVENLRQTIGKTGDEQLYLMAGLMVCDELWDARDQLLKAEVKLKNQSDQQATNAGDLEQKTVVTPVSSAPRIRPAAAPVQAASGAATPSSPSVAPSVPETEVQAAPKTPDSIT